METWLAILAGVMTAAGVYLMLNTNVIRFMFGLVLIGNAANISILTVGRHFGTTPPLIPEGQSTTVGTVANALPQALILTAIVISFGILAFTVVLLFRAYEELGTVDSNAMRTAEPADMLGGGKKPSQPVETREQA